MQQFRQRMSLRGAKRRGNLPVRFLILLRDDTRRLARKHSLRSRVGRCAFTLLTPNSKQVPPHQFMGFPYSGHLPGQLQAASCKGDGFHEKGSGFPDGPGNGSWHVQLRFCGSDLPPGTYEASVNGMNDPVVVNTEFNESTILSVTAVGEKETKGLDDVAIDKLIPPGNGKAVR